MSEYLYDLSVVPEWPLSEQHHELTALRLTAERYRVALEWYADNNNRKIDDSKDLSCAIERDFGERARTALKVVG